MVTIRKKSVDSRKYFYLQHTIRTSKGVQTREKYLGTRLPANIEEAKRDFLIEIYKERWYPLLDKIRSNYAKEQRKMPRSALQKQVRSFSVRFTYDTTRIEGSKLTYRETADLLERGLSPRARPREDISEVEAHDRVFREILEYEKDISLRIILLWHKRLFEGTKPDIAGKVRAYQVAISGSRFMPPSPVEIQPLLREFFRWYDRSKSSLHPVELAATVHLRFVTIHPFADGNGRMSRLLMNFVLQKHGFPPLNVPYEDRRSYYNALERSQVKKIDSVFIQWFFKRYLKENSAYA
ncbi:MAG: Fic family protein [Candidatus Thermoplasmatota archaeon]|nr:Fic family protein [Candidatus Thermoplasmatota archaeon]